MSTPIGRAPEDGRVRAAHFGRRAERAALLLLMLKGYRPLARNYVVKGGEIDIVMRRGDVVVFVEVKARPAIETASVTVSAQKRRRIARAARAWLARNPWAARCTLRGDGVFLAPRRWPRHVPNAFELDLV